MKKKHNVMSNLKLGINEILLKFTETIENGKNQLRVDREKQKGKF